MSSKSRNLKIGDKVSVIDDDLDGIIVSIVDDNISFVSDDGMQFECLVNELVLCEDLTKHCVDTKKYFSSKDFEVRDKPNFKKSRSKLIEIDLHIETTAGKYVNLSNSEIIRLQISLARERLDEAIELDIEQVVFIHGVGNGTLKCELSKLFRSNYSGIVKYNDAPLHVYGRGATTVHIL
ncbi:Smr/MutS family protein [Ichthyobacterium seriolicida]|uniref:Smr domain-containing protein n=1 Tax=Ichthyobacterium seriolicida TaxID=242600 RepID=A0A1J1DXH7_9FLAO|nr:Smr/MutS family protein [Ichthyobacterium seriolicida]BAV94559.1 hypothetical protein JBKA6_0546 [Ichthyobacterium seriolicida]